MSSSATNSSSVRDLIRPLVSAQRSSRMSSPTLGSSDSNNDFNLEGYFSKKRDIYNLLSDCKKGAIERAKYTFINNVIKPHLLDTRLKKTDPNLVDSRENYLTLLSLVYNFASYHTYYELERNTSIKWGKNRNVELHHLRTQVNVWIEFIEKKYKDQSGWTYKLNGADDSTFEDDIAQFKEFMDIKRLKYNYVISLLNYVNAKPPHQNEVYKDRIGRLTNIFTFSIIPFDIHGIPPINPDNNTNIKGDFTPLSYNSYKLQLKNFEDFVTRLIKNGQDNCQSNIPRNFLTNVDDKTDPLVLALTNNIDFSINQCVKNNHRNIGDKSLFGSFHKPIIDVKSVFTQSTDSTEHLRVHKKMNIQRHYLKFKPGDIVRIYATQNLINRNILGRIEGYARGASGKTYGGHIAIEIEHFYIQNDERKSELYSFGFASGTLLEEDLTKPGYISNIFSRITPLIGSKIRSVTELKGGALYTPDYPLSEKYLSQINVSDRAPKFNYIELVATGQLNDSNLHKLRSELNSITINDFYGSKLYNNTINIKNLDEYLDESEINTIKQNNINNQIYLGNLKYDISAITDTELRKKQEHLLNLLNCNTFFTEVICYYWNTHTLYCENTRRDASKKGIPIFNCTSWAESVFDDIMECSKSKLVSAPDRCFLSETYPFKGCDEAGEVLFEHKGVPFGARSRKMKQLLKKSRINTLTKRRYLTRKPSKSFFVNSNGGYRKTKIKKNKKK